MNSEGHNEAHDSPNTLAFESKCRQCNVYKNILDSGDNEQKSGRSKRKRAPKEQSAIAIAGYLKAIWPEIFGSVFGRFSANLITRPL